MLRITDGRIVALGLGLGLALAACQQQVDVMPPEPIPPPPFPPEGAAPAPAAIGSDERLGVAIACASDIERFCAGVPPRQGYIKACMKAHVTELSAGCFDAVMGAIAAAHPP